MLLRTFLCFLLSLNGAIKAIPVMMYFHDSSSNNLDKELNNKEFRFPNFLPGFSSNLFWQKMPYANVPESSILNKKFVRYF